MDHAITGTGHAVTGHEFRRVICLTMHSSFHILTCDDSARLTVHVLTVYVFCRLSCVIQ